PLITGRPLAFPVALLVLAAVPLAPVSLVSALVMSLVRFIPANRGREIVGVLAVITAVGVQLANLRFNPAYGGAGGGRLAFAALRANPLVSTPWLPPGWGS